jgi:hypothetical protein
LFLLGLAVIVLEARSGKVKVLPRKFTDAWDAQFRKYALFLRFISGHGGLYFFAGTLQLSQLSIADLAVGNCMTLVGISYIVIGR